LPLAVAETGCVNDAADGGVAYQKSVIVKGAQHAFRGQPFFSFGFLGRNTLAVEPFHDLVGLQSDLQQGDQSFHAGWRLEKDGADGEWRFPLVMERLDVVLLLVLPE